ncbi:hypothetical protein PP175_28740 (plasmid) [Aneurinibacillus sp. Ricciae_BoGa-3]|uniref:hypothetical protein n=1 Tax=Aneurinibacillus sp. Ricciae_BoGa-3 TaxID=3022697 RepID=UPI002342199C|nr:hypothetical protein [Aneurinibacillus sp. Ricciae_BoGa-3]WCK57178.1 hypothetical protein PP175_28740 [Aneurinibacillus sp. Ricciae_BoGa-3]
MQEKDVLTGKETGRCGLEGLLWAKRMILAFESSIYTKNGELIRVGWLDNRRRDAYHHGLKKIGFKYGQIDNEKCLFKIIDK